MTTPYLVDKGNVQLGTIIRHPLTVMAAAATVGYTVDLPPGSYDISMTINSSLTGTTSTIGTIRPWANAAQTVVTNQDMTVIRPADTAYTIKSVTFPAGNVGKIVHISPISTIPASPIVLPYGLRFLVTKGTAATGERLEVVVTAIKRG